MKEKLQKLMQEKKYEKVVKLAFSASGPLAENSEAYKTAQSYIGQSFTYNADIIENRDQHFQHAAEFVMREIMANNWKRS